MTGIVLRRDTKLALEATPPVEGELVYATDTDEFGYLDPNTNTVKWVVLGQSNANWGQIQGVLGDQLDLQTALDLKAGLVHTHQIDDVQNLQAELNNRYLKTDFIDHNTGIAGQPVKTNSDGFIDNSLIQNTTYILKGQFTPDINNEYPNVSGLVTGDYFLINNVDINNGYTYQSGDIAGITVYNNDQLTYTNTGWILVPGNVNPDAYLRRDGTTSMLGNIDVNNHLIKNVSDPVDNLDAVNKQTLDSGLAQKSNIGHSHHPGNGSEIEYEPHDINIQAHINLQDGSNPHKTKFVTLEDTPVIQDPLKPYLGYKGMRVTVNDSEDGLIFEPSSGNSILSADYLFDNETIEPNGQYDKQLRVNNLDFTQVTEIYISKLDRYLNDRSYGLSSLEIDDLIGFRNPVDSSYMIFSVNSVSVGSDPSFFKVQVTPISNLNSTWLDGTQLNVELFLTGEKWFKNLHDTPNSYVGEQYKFPRVKSTEDGIEFSALTINDIGMVDINGNETTNPSILQQKLNERIGGSGRAGGFILNKSASLVTEETDTTENILGYNIIDGTPYNKTAQIGNIVLGDPSGTVHISGSISGDIKLNNNISVVSYENTYNTTKKLIGLNTTNEVEIGNIDTKTILISDVNFDPVVRKSTNDYMIHTDEGFTYQDFYTTRDLATQNQANIGDITTLTTTDKTSIVNAINEIDLNTNTNSANIGDITTLTTTNKTNTVNAINEVDQNIKNHIAQTVGNPHNVTKSDVGLGNVDNTADLDKPISNLTQAALDLKADYSFTDNIGITINDGTITTNNVIKWTTEVNNLPGLPLNVKYVDISQADQAIKLSGTIISDVLLYNDISISALKENPVDLNDRVNLIKRTTTSTGNFYKNSDVQVGDINVQTVLYATNALNNALDPVVRKYYTDVDGNGNPGTRDYLIYTTEQFNISDYALVTYVDTQDSILQTNIGDLTTLVTVDKTSLVNAVNEVKGYTDANSTNITNHTSDTSIHFTQNKVDFDPAAGDTTVVITGVVLTANLIDVFINGILQRDTTYTVTDNGVDTTITFNTAFAGGEWVRVNYFI